MSESEIFSTTATCGVVYACERIVTFESIRTTDGGVSIVTESSDIVSLAASGQRVAVADQNKTVSVWEWTSEQPPRCIVRSAPFPKKLMCVAVHPTADVVFAADALGDVYVVDIPPAATSTSPTPRLVFGHMSSVTALTTSVTPAGVAMIASADKDGKIRVCNYPAMYDILSFCLHKSMVTACAFYVTSDHTYLISSDSSGYVMVHDAPSGRRLSFVHFQQPISSLLVAEGMCVVAIDGECDVLGLSLPSLECVRRVTLGRGIAAMSYFPPAKTLIVIAAAPPFILHSLIDPAWEFVARGETVADSLHLNRVASEKTLATLPHAVRECKRRRDNGEEGMEAGEGQQDGD